MNIGDTLTVAAMANNSVTFSERSEGGSRPDIGWFGYHYAIKGRIRIGAYCAQFLGYSKSQFRTYLNGEWAYGKLVESSGTDGGWVYDWEDGLTGYFAISYSVSNGHTYTANSIDSYQSYYAPRIKGNNLRVIASDFSAYEAAGTSKITASLVNSGRVCTY